MRTGEVLNPYQRDGRLDIDRVTRARDRHTVSPCNDKVAFCLVQRTHEPACGLVDAIGNAGAFGTYCIRHHCQSRARERWLAGKCRLEVGLGIEEVNIGQWHHSAQVEVEQTLCKHGLLCLFPEKIAPYRRIV